MQSEQWFEHVAAKGRCPQNVHVRPLAPEDMIAPDA